MKKCDDDDSYDDDDNDNVDNDNIILLPNLQPKKKQKILEKY